MTVRFASEIPFSKKIRDAGKMRLVVVCCVVALYFGLSEGFTNVPLFTFLKDSRRSFTSLKASESPTETVSIEYCTGCRWMLRSAWTAQELLSTFQEELDSVTLIPSHPPAPGGIFVST
mmetsp:Transcript_33933/g.78256  ORF Transcript_33933/g.78256 Transcript_33933/m.78256 type:complete len:119 (-) Transcript_33933:665-1021(-)